MSDSKSADKLPVLGFLGTGTINSALVRAICRAELPEYPIVVSPRSADRAAALAAAFPGRVSVAASFQEVVDRADCVFVAILPKAVEEVYRSLRFPDEMHIIDLTPSVTEEQVREWTGWQGEFSHIIPLAFVAELRGPMVLYPPESSIRGMMEKIADLVPLDDRRVVAAGQILTSFEAPFFTLLDMMTDWAVELGFDRELACAYVSGLFRAMSEHACMSGPERLHDLADEFTPGGFNWRSKNYINERDGIRMWIDIGRQMMDDLNSKLGK